MWRKTEPHGRQTTQEFRVTHHLCEHVRGVASCNGLRFNSSLCPKLLHGQRFHSSTTMPMQYTFTRTCVNMKRHGHNTKRAQSLLHDQLQTNRLRKRLDGVAFNSASLELKATLS